MDNPSILSEESGDLSSRSFDSNIHRALTEFDALVAELNTKDHFRRLGKTLETLESQGFNSLQDLVAAIHKQPPREGMMKNLPWFLGQGLLPLVEAPGEHGQIIIAISANERQGSGSHGGMLRNPLSISIPMQDAVMPRIEKFAFRTTFVLVPGPQFDDLVELVQSPDRRREALQLIDPEKARTGRSPSSES